MNFCIRTKVPGHYDRVFAAFDRELFEALKPPVMGLDLDRFDGSSPGNEVHLRVGLGPIKTRWVSVITEEIKSESENYFIDEGKVLPWPLVFWRHKHRVLKLSESESEILDDIEFKTPFKWLDKVMYPVLVAQFKMRSPAYRRYFTSFE